MRFLADENFSGPILNGLRRLIPELDVIRAQDTEIYKASDPDLLEWAAKNQRIVLSHDVQTLIGFAYDRVDKGSFMPGVVIVSGAISNGQAIEELSLMIGASTPDEFEDQVKYIPIT